MLDVPDGMDVHEWMLTQGWSDGLPLVPPTLERVEAMLTGTARMGHELLGKCAPCYGEVTVEKCAIAAVMAGCAPRQFTVVLAAVEAMLHPNFNIHGVSATTMGATPCIIVNGPVRHAAGLNMSHGALGSGSRANAAIGRTLKLVLQNVGGAKLRGTESTTIGTPLKFTACLAEWEERASVWEPLHVAATERANEFERSDSAVTIMAVMSGPHQIVDGEMGLDGTPEHNAEQLCQLLASSLSSAYSPAIPMINNAVLVISPEHYDTLVTGGYRSKAQLQCRLWDLTNKHMVPHIPTLVGRVIVRKLVARFGKSSVALFVIKACGHLIGTLIGLFARFFTIVTGRGLTLLPKFDKPESLHVVVAGGPAGKFSAFMPSFGFLREGPISNLSRPVTCRVETPQTTSGAYSTPPEATTRVLNPTASLPAPFTLAKRSDTGELLGDIALLSISKRGSDELLRCLAHKLCKRFPCVNVAHFTKPTFSRPAPAELMQHIIDSGFKHAVVALAD